MAHPSDNLARKLPEELPLGVESPLKLEFARCCLCDAEDAEPVGVGEDFEYRTSRDSFLALRCRSCSLVYISPRPALSELDRIYPPNYHAFEFSAENFGLAHTVRRRLEARRLLGYCRDLGAGARILDVGCGDGFHLDLLREFGDTSWVLEGIDASERAVSAGRKRGFTIHHATVESADVAPASYDLVLLIATIEHVGDPVGVLRAVRKLLKPGGRAVIVTDNTANLDFRIFKARHWGGYHFPRHWNLFHPGSIRKLAERSGLEVERLGTILSPVNWVYSIRNWLTDTGAPVWLVERFSLKSPVSLGVFTILDGIFQLFGHGALLCAVLTRRGEGREHV